MFKNRSFYLLIMMVVLVATACVPQVAVTPALQARGCYGLVRGWKSVRLSYGLLI
jgi:hypothetical protein